MAHTSIMIHNAITGMTANNAVSGSLTIKVHDENDTYSDVCFMTGDAALAKALADTFEQYTAHRDAQRDAIADRTHDEIANGDGLDTPDEEAEDDHTFNPDED